MHKVQLKKSFTGERRTRAGISVTRTEAYEGELTKDQLAAIKADPELTVTELKEETSSRKMVDKPQAKKS